jgi:hypothetical protein
MGLNIMEQKKLCKFKINKRKIRKHGNPKKERNSQKQKKEREKIKCHKI